ncbi:MAG: DUF3347 domain-containing protein [Verrucomicrobiota bacterium]
MNLFFKYLVAIALLTTNVFAHSYALKPQDVDPLLAPYFEIQMGLAKDKLDVAQKATTHLKDVLTKGPSEEEAPVIRTLLNITDKLSESTDIQRARQHFHVLSQEMILVVEHVGTANTTAYQMRCTMAFDHTGASWLQANDELINPYWGARMLRCGHEETIYAPKQ